MPLHSAASRPIWSGAGDLYEGDDIDLLSLPVPHWHEEDGGRYIGTAHVVVTRDMDEGWVNLGCYRVMVHDKDKLALYISSGKQGRIIRQKYFDLGRPCPVAISYTNRFPFAFVVRNEIKSPDELKGKRLAISRFGSSSEVTTRMLLRQFKLDPDKDVNIIQVTGTSRLPAIVAGQLDGTLLGTYDVPALLESGCCRVLVDMLEMPLEYARFGQVVPTQLLKTKCDLLLKFSEGLIEGIHVFKTNKDLALSVLRQEGIKGLEYSYPRIAAAMRERPTPEIKDVQAVMDSVRTPKSKLTQAKDVIEPSLIEEIDKTGYITKLYGK